MADMIIPGWALALMSGIGTLLLGWLIWLTLRTNQNEKDIAINTANDTNVAKELERIYDAIEKMDNKLDLFLAEELKFFKEQFKNKNNIGTG